MANLLFRPSELQNELSALRSLAEPFLDRTNCYDLAALGSELAGLKAGRGEYTLEIPESRPLKTRVSEGEFEPQNKSSSRQVYGLITGIWQVKVVSQSIPDPTRPNRKGQPTTLIGFTGKASTVIVVQDVKTASSVACWKMELGDANSPGCFFHTFASADHSFPVPRHPNLFATPMSAIAFALGELFQGGWEQTVSGGGDAPNRWRSIQAKRFKAILNWQLQQVEKTTSSPWCSLKVAKPDSTLFL